ncbi:MAG: endonuclease III domain-containing protein [Candidatus Altiarchaeota archaeon]|nr:endonuclease III domain-containing protein [Candidatus Altiarchaeota archaeon]
MNLLEVYESLLGFFGPQHWWPAETEFEVIVGAILTQAAAWKNVESAINNLKSGGLLSPESLWEVNESRLAEKIKPAGCFNAKARKLKSFIGFLFENYGGDLRVLFSLPRDHMRSELLSVWGIGPETADSIILYAANKPSFVVDAYTKRIFSRLGLVEEDISYSDLKQFFEHQLPVDVSLYSEFHALIVALGKNFCRKKPVCRECPIQSLCVFGRR